MRLAVFLLPFLLIACKTTGGSQPHAEPQEAIENEDQLPACDDVTVGRAYWVRSINMQMLCAEGGTWQPRQVDPDGREEPSFGPRGIK